MAAPPAPPLRASWSSPIHGATMHLRHTPGRRRRSAPVKTQARKRDLFRSYWPEPYWPDPDPDREMLKHQRAFRAAMGPREPPAMFRKEKDDISKYMMEISSSSADDPWHLNNKVMALTVCTEAQKALDLASMIMDLTDSTSFGTTEFSRHIANQVVTMDILHDGMKHAQSYISQLVGHRRVAIYDLNRAKLNSIRAKANFAAAT
ncbi:hypothetical protein PVAP13_3NG222469 [Panicum virgatum]|uniref:Uncharacterized protein n=1 Tax=Panicum virgatum TaxID=38727 RepID=A0A8T0U2L5_PANVG|nr:hypothetical protein PVAP13_3NG222469 [Panicum virgatum]